MRCSQRTMLTMAVIALLSVISPEFSGGALTAMAATDEMQLTYNKNFGGTGDDAFYKVIATSDGGFLAVGKSSSNDFDLAGIYKGGTSDAIIVKCTSNGTVSWKKSYGGTRDDYFYDAAQTTDGGYIAVGHSNSADGDITGYKGGTSNTFDGIIVKYDANGEVLWNKNFGGTKNDYFRGVCATDDGGCVVAGYAASSDGDMEQLTYKGGSFDAILVKYKTDGTVEWKKNFGGTGADFFYSVEKSGNNYITVGYTASSNVDLSDVYNGGYSNDAVIVIYGISGDVINKKCFGGTNGDSFSGVVSAADGGYAVVGYSNSTDLDMLNINKGNKDAIIVKYNTNLDVLWKRTFGGSGSDSFSGVILCSDGGFMAVGDSNSTDGDCPIVSSNATDAILVRYASDGTVKAKKTYGGAGGDYFRSVVSVDLNTYITVGYSNSTDGDLNGQSKGGNDATVSAYYYGVIVPKPYTLANLVVSESNTLDVSSFITNNTQTSSQAKVMYALYSNPDNKLLDIKIKSESFGSQEGRTVSAQLHLRTGITQYKVKVMVFDSDILLVKPLADTAQYISAP